MRILNQVQVNLIYNTNRNLFPWIEIFVSTTDVYNPTADRRSCQLPNRNKQHTCFQCSLCFQISKERSYPLPIYWYRVFWRCDGNCYFPCTQLFVLL